MSALYRTVQKQYRIGLLITDKNGDIKRVISERFRGRSEAAILKVVRRISDKFLNPFLAI